MEHVDCVQPELQWIDWSCKFFEAHSEISGFSDGAGRERVGLCTPTARRQPQLIIYETFNVPAMYVVIQAVLSLHASDG